MKTLLLITSLFLSITASASLMNAQLQEGDLVTIEVTKKIVVPFDEDAIDVTSSSTPSVMNYGYLKLKKYERYDRTILQGTKINLKVSKISTFEEHYNTTVVYLKPSKTSSAIESLFINFHPNQNGGTYDGFKDNASSVVDSIKVISINPSFKNVEIID